MKEHEEINRNKQKHGKHMEKIIDPSQFGHVAKQEGVGNLSGED